MKPTFLLLLVFCCLNASGQNFQRSGKPKFIAPEGSMVHDMGESGRGVVLAVGATLRTETDDESSDGFISFYDKEITSSFVSKQMNLMNDGALLAVSPDDRGGAWVAGYQTSGRNIRQGILHRMLWDEESRFFYSRGAIIAAVPSVNVQFNTICRLPNGQVILGGQFEYNRKRGGGRIEPVLYRYHDNRLEQLVLPQLTVGSSAAVTDLLPSSAGNEVAVIVEHLSDVGTSEDRYQEFVLQLFSGSRRVELTTGWEIGRNDRITCPGFSINVNDNVVATGTNLRTSAGAPWLGVAAIRAAEMEVYPVQSAVNNSSLGGNAILAGQINTVSGANRQSSSFKPDYTHLEEFLYFPEQRSYKEEGVSNGKVPANAFYDADFYEDGNFDLWLYGHQETRPFTYRPIAFLYEADEATMVAGGRGLTALTRGMNRELALNGQLTIKEMSLDFGNGTTNFLPAGKQGKLKIVLHNSGPELYYLKALVAVIGQARGIQFLSRQPSDSQGLRGIGRDKNVELFFPVETTEKVSVETGAKFVLQIVKDNKILLEHETAIITEGNNYEGFRTIIDKNFGENTTRSAPDRSGSRTFKITTQFSSARPLEAGDIVVRNKKIALNKGRGKVADIRLVSNTGQYNYEVDLEVELDPLLNEISFEIQPAGQPATESDTRYVYYSNLPSLHYVGIAPDYSKLKMTEGFSPLKFNQQDVRDVADELTRNQGGDRLYSRVVPKLLTSVEETSTQNLRDFFDVLGSRALDPASSDYIAEDDLVVIHFAAHGGLKGNKYAILPSDYERTMSTRILNYEREVLEPLLRLNRRILILIDACHNPLPEGSRGGGDPDARMMEKLFELHRGVEGIATFAAASQGERAYEHERWNNGLFTEALLEALRGVTGFDAEGAPIRANQLFATEPDEVLTINELSKYLSLRVPGLIRQTKGLEGKQHPTLIINRQSDRLPDDLPLFRLPVPKE